MTLKKQEELTNKLSEAIVVGGALVMFSAGIFYLILTR